jgi:multimeric flavodoxin WrbA
MGIDLRNFKQKEFLIYMKLTCLFGSARYDGNSAAIANRFVETAASLEAEITKYELNRLNYRGCLGCCACKTGRDRCIQKDDLTKVLADIEKADVLMLSTPVYFGDIPGQVKCVVDRMYSFFKPDYIRNPEPSRLHPGKKLVFIITQGGPESVFSETPQRYINVLTRTLALSETHLIRACFVGPGGIPKSVPDHYLQRAEETARATLSNNVFK